jgi:PEGA domain
MQAMESAQAALHASVDDLRTIAGELAENCHTLDQLFRASDLKMRDTENTLARFDSIIETRLTQIEDATVLLMRAEKLLARFDGISTEIDRKGMADRLLAWWLRAREFAQTGVEHLKPLLRSRFLSAISALQEAAVHGSSRLGKHRLRRGSRKVTAGTLGVFVAGTLGVFVLIGLVAMWRGGNADGTRQPLVEPPAQARQLTNAIPQPSGAVQSLPLSSATPAPVRSAPPVGRMEILSNPPSATVLVDGKPVGETPMSSLEVLAGARLISIERPGFRPWTATIDVPADGLTNVKATLQRNRPRSRRR